MARHLRLDIVLRLRELAEEKARLQLAAALDGYRSATAAARAASSRLETELAGMASVQRTGGAAATLTEASDQVALAEMFVDRCGADLDRATEQLMEARSELARATQQREIVARLRARLLLEERAQVERREAERIGDLVTARHVRELIAESDR